ncbi:MAG TPA: hypothetical protein VG253_00665 [Streptosporangiaceae bacterium]|nr:hypothetical protein [Streptosporangiaceae bacterium]
MEAINRRAYCWVNRAGHRGDHVADPLPLLWLPGGEWVAGRWLAAADDGGGFGQGCVQRPRTGAIPGRLRQWWQRAAEFNRVGHRVDRGCYRCGRPDHLVRQGRDGTVGGSEASLLGGVGCTHPPRDQQ